MTRSSKAKIVLSLLALTSAAAHATSPTRLPYSASMTAYGPVAIATTSSTSRAAYVVAATTDKAGGLEVTAWSDPTGSLTRVGSLDIGGHSVTTVAVTGLDASHVVTADVDYAGVLCLRTWGVSTSEVALLNSCDGNTEETVTPAFSGSAPTVAIVALSPTNVVTAVEDQYGVLRVEEWTVGVGSAPAVKTSEVVGTGSSMQEVAMAVIDSETVMTAIVTTGDDLELDTWQVTSAGVAKLDYYPHSKDSPIPMSGALYSALSIGAGSFLTYSPPDSAHPTIQVGYTRLAFTPIIDQSDFFLVIDWRISSSGAISLAHSNSSGVNRNAGATAACMLPTGVPMSAYDYQDVTNWELNVGWYGEGETSDYKIDTAPSGVKSLGAVAAGADNFNPFFPASPVNAYFVTGAFTTSATTQSGTLQIHVWSFPIDPPLL